MNDVRQAAERITEGEWTEEDLQVVARAYLAEHPLDDDEPITAEWLRSLKGIVVEFGSMFAIGMRLDLRNYGDEKGWHLECEDTGIGVLTTRRQVRQLLSALAPARPTKGPQT